MDNGHNPDLSVHIPLLWTIASTVAERLGRGTAAEDVLGEVYIEAEKLAREYTPERGGVANYLCSFVPSRVIRTERRNRRTPDPARLEPRPANGEPAYALPARWSDSLSPGQYDAVRRHVAKRRGRGGMSETARTHLHRAKHLLRIECQTNQRPNGSATASTRS